MIHLVSSVDHTIITGDGRSAFNRVVLSKDTILMFSKLKEFILPDVSRPLKCTLNDRESLEHRFNVETKLYKWSYGDIEKHFSLVFIEHVDRWCDNFVEYHYPYVYEGTNYDNRRMMYKGYDKYQVIGYKSGDAIIYADTSMYETFKGIRVELVIDDIVSLLNSIYDNKPHTKVQKEVSDNQGWRLSKDEGSLFKNVKLKFYDRVNRLEWDGMEEGRTLESIVREHLM